MAFILFQVLNALQVLKKPDFTVKQQNKRNVTKDVEETSCPSVNVVPLPVCGSAPSSLVTVVFIKNRRNNTFFGDYFQRGVNLHLSLFSLEFAGKKLNIKDSCRSLTAAALLSGTAAEPETSRSRSRLNVSFCWVIVFSLVVFLDFLEKCRYLCKILCICCVHNNNNDDDDDDDDDNNVWTVCFAHCVRSSVCFFFTDRFASSSYVALLLSQIYFFIVLGWKALTVRRFLSHRQQALCSSCVHVGNK